jgi:alanine dehydrogenase
MRTAGQLLPLRWPRKLESRSFRSRSRNKPHEVGPGQHINLIGSNFISKAEADIAVFRKSTLVTVDSKEQAKAEAGDFVTSLNVGALHWSDIVELAPLLVGRYPGRESPEDVTIFKSLGIGIEDIALAVRIVELAKQQGLGREIL